MENDQPSPLRPWNEWEDDVIRRLLNSDVPNRAEQLVRLPEQLGRSPDDVERRIRLLYNYPLEAEPWN